MKKCCPVLSVVFVTLLLTTNVFGQDNDKLKQNRVPPIQTVVALTVQGHQLRSSEELAAMDLPAIGQERRWATDILASTEERLIRAAAQQKVRPPSPQMQLISEDEYKLQTDLIDRKVRAYENVQRDPAQIETQKAAASLDLLDQMRQRSRLDLRLLQTKDYRQQEGEFNSYNQELSDRQSDLLQLRHYVSVIDDTIAKSLNSANADESFRKIMGLSFAVLVGMLIIGFYKAAHSDPEMRRNFLSDDRGLQFITLFSLVIAIVLFGVMKILEGRELSALLGGLSGYILGRSNLGRKPAESTEQTQPGR